MNTLTAGRASDFPIISLPFSSFGRFDQFDRPKLRIRRKIAGKPHGDLVFPLLEEQRRRRRRLRGRGRRPLRSKRCISWDGWKE